MRTHTRRQLLAVLPAVGCGLAGCLGAEGGSSGISESATEGPGRNVPEEQTATDPPTMVRRGDSERPAIRLVDREEDDTDADREDSHLRDSGIFHQNTVIDNAATADRLTVESADDSSDETDLASFVSETAFDRESLYLETRRIEQCYRLSLCYITWQSDSVRTDYSRLLRPYDERCAVDTKVFVSWLFRLPVALDAETISSFGSSTGSSRCGRASGSRTDRSVESRPPVTNRSASPNGSGSA